MKRLLLALSCSLAWNFSGGSIAAPASSSPNATASGLKSPSLQKLFRKAMEAFEAKKYDEAVPLFEHILAKQEDHIPSKIHLARSHYQMKNLKDALKVFQQIDVEELEPDVAYDYGQVAFRSVEYEPAIKAFGKVPNGHALYDLAGYYGGISAYKLGDFQLSLDLFDQAVVLPSKLVRSQKLYRKEAAKKLLLKQKQELRTGIKPNPPVSGAVASPPPVPPAHFLLEPERAIAATYSYLSQTVETKKGSSTQDDLVRNKISLKWGSPPLADPAARKQTVYLVKASGASVSLAEREVSIVPNAEEAVQFYSLERFKPDSLVRVEAAGGYEAAMGEKASFGGLLGAYAYVAEGDFVKKILYVPYLSMFLAQKGELLETRITAESHARFDDEKLLLTHSLQEGAINFYMSPRAFVGLSGDLNEYSYNASRLSGPDWNGRFFLHVGYSQKKSLSLSLGGFYEIAQGWRLYDTAPDLPLLKFNLSQAGLLAKAEAYVTSWLTLGLYGRLAQRDYASPEPAGALEYLDEKYGNKISQIGLQATVSKSF